MPQRKNILSCHGFVCNSFICNIRQFPQDKSAFNSAVSHAIMQRHYRSMD